jgi:hypothetical protein
MDKVLKFEDFVNESFKDKFKDRFFFINPKKGTKCMLAHNSDPVKNKKQEKVAFFDIDRKGLETDEIEDVGLGDGKGNFFQGLTKEILKKLDY